MALVRVRDQNGYAVEKYAGLFNVGPDLERIHRGTASGEEVKMEACRASEIVNWAE